MHDNLRLDRQEYVFVCLFVDNDKQIAKKGKKLRKNKGKRWSVNVSLFFLLLWRSWIRCRLFGSVDLFGLMSLKHSNSFFNLGNKDDENSDGEQTRCGNILSPWVNHAIRAYAEAQYCRFPAACQWFCPLHQVALPESRGTIVRRAFAFVLVEWHWQGQQASMALVPERQSMSDIHLVSRRREQARFEMIFSQGILTEFGRFRAARV